MTLAAMLAFSALLASGQAAPAQMQRGVTYAQDVQLPPAPNPDQSEQKQEPETERKNSAPQATQEPAAPANGEQNAAPSGAQENTPASGKQMEPPESPKNSVSSHEEKKAGPTASKKKSTKHKRKKASAAADPDEPTRRIVRNGSTRDPELDFAPSVTGAQASKQKQETEHLLQLADANVKRASTHPLTPAQEDTAGQIKLFMEQSKQAIDAGDLQRAHNLAFKAELLSRELMRQQP